MQVVFFVEKENLNKVKDLVGKGPNSLDKKLVTIISKKNFGLDGGSYLIFDANSGVAERLAREVLEGYTTVVEDTSEILKKVEEMKETKLNGKYIVFSVDDDKLEKVRNIVGIGENSLVKQSITIRDNKSLGLETDGYYIMIDGSEEACEEARERLKDVAKELEGDEKQKVIDKMKEMEESAMEGFGGIFG